MERPAKRGKRCVAFGCGNTNLNEGISLHAFPRDKGDFRQWVKFVKTKRDKWEVTKHSVLCSEHFEEKCYPAKYKLLANMGCTPPKKKTLLEHAIPTIQSAMSISDHHDEPEADAMTPSSSKKPRTAYTKREITRVRTRTVLLYSCLHIIIIKKKSSVIDDI